MKLVPFADNSEIRFRGTGKRFEALTNQTTDYDFTVPFDCLINGLDFFSDSVNGDWITVSVVDVNNVLGFGAGVVLDTFATEWLLEANKHKSASVQLNYAARLKQGLVVRITYNNTTLEQKTVGFNLYLHKTNQPIIL